MRQKVYYLSKNNPFQNITKLISSFEMIGHFQVYQIIYLILAIKTIQHQTKSSLWASELNELTGRGLRASQSMNSHNYYQNDFDDNNEQISRRIGSGNRQGPSTKKQSGQLGSGRKNRTSVARKPSVKRLIHPSLHAVWDEYNHLCALAKFQATFTITYETASGNAQLMDKMPANARSKGRCDQFDEEPVLDVTWKDSQLVGGSQQGQNSTGGFTFRIIFQKFADEGQWGVQQMQLLYNTGHPVFRGATKPRKFIVRSNRDDYRLQFRSGLSSSMLCPSPPPIQLYDSDGTLMVIARLSNMQLQAYEFHREANNFDSFMRCEQVSFGSGVAHPLTTIRNDSLTFAMGVMTVCIASLTVVGYAFYRSKVVDSEKYKNII